MSLAASTRLGPYEIDGAGGMGEVPGARRGSPPAPEPGGKLAYPLAHPSNNRFSPQPKPGRT